MEKLLVRGPQRNIQQFGNAEKSPSKTTQISRTISSLKDNGMSCNVKLTVEEAYHEILHSIGNETYHNLLHLVKNELHHKLLHALGDDSYHKLLHVLEEASKKEKNRL